jgi:phosphoribosylaminoimidazolecarboxamide formyltransferase/IMP cyclohydrolase
MKIALLSVYDKKGITEFAKELAGLGYMILASGGTAKEVKEEFDKPQPAGLLDLSRKYRLIEVSDYTGFPESPHGLVKTLHPKIHGGFLLDPENTQHAKYMLENGISHIEILACNLYPFAETIKKEGITPQEAAHQIDIGGPTMVRAAAKAALLYDNTYVIVDPADYQTVIDKLKGVLLDPEQNSVDERNKRLLRQQLSKKAFAHTAEYEKTIDDFLQKKVG